MYSKASSKFLFNISHFYQVGSLLLLFVSIGMMPIFFGSSLNDYSKAMNLSVLLSVLLSINFFLKDQQLKFSFLDIAWWGLIAHHFVSMQWSTNPYFALYGGWSMTLVYIAFKFFEATTWSNKGNVLRVYLSILVVLLVGIIYYIVSSRKGVIQRSSISIQWIGDNLNFAGSLAVLILPFLIFYRAKIVFIINIILLTFIFYVLYKTGSAQVVVVLFSLTILYILYFLQLSKRIIIYVLITSFVVGLIFLPILMNLGKEWNSVSFVLKEFSEQNDRLTMWYHSWLLFWDQPFLGVGKNNWSTDVYQFGYQDYASYSNSAINPKNYKHAHNIFFQILSEQGLWGIACYGALVASTIFTFLKRKIYTSLEIAAAVGLISYIGLASMYGVLYNHYPQFKGVPILIACYVAIINPSLSFSWSIKSRWVSVPLLIAALCASHFFYYTTKNHHTFKTGLKAFRQHRFDEAETYFWSIKDQWDNAMTCQFLGSVWERQGHQKEALTAYEVAIFYDPHKPQLLLSNARILFNQEQYNKALQLTIQAYKLCPIYQANHSFLVRSYLKTQQYLLAEKYASQFLADREQQLNRLKNVQFPTSTSSTLVEKNEKTIIKLEKDIQLFDSLLQRAISKLHE